jgi:biotin carboxyl carrier protein
MNKNPISRRRAGPMVATAVPVQIDVVGEEVFTTDLFPMEYLNPSGTFLCFRCIGRVVSIAVEKGSLVKKGQTLINVDEKC